ncbi:MAG TPA: hypothetical protein VI583_07205 [Cyclobacteriaceae bacterium]|nr:hypothetical protein [Cyclobacteriaceae bacterium]
MKKVLFALFSILMVYTEARPDEIYPEDTIVINFGNNTRIMFIVNSREDLKTLQNYDLNAMLGELSVSVDTMQAGDKYLRIEDNTGTRYLKDTTLFVEDERTTDSDDYETLYREWSQNDEIDIDENEDEADDHDDFDRDFRKERRYREKGTKNYFNFEIGMNNYLQDGDFPDTNDEPFTIKPWGSWFVGITNTNRTRILGPLFLDWGGGVNWYNFKFQNSTVRVNKVATETMIFTDSSIADPVKSKLTCTYINAYIVPMLNFGRSGRRRDIFHWGNFDNALRIGAGAYVGYRVDSYAKNVWKENEKKRSNRNNDSFFLNNLRYGVRARFGFQSLDFFVDYDMNELFIEGKGPKLNPFSFGIIF